ncbi:MAG: ATP-binding cassette domain-containing protein [Anaerolineae bacterium]|nr:ATP-binding cassette domain-containing protein [Anaerolineae bacterium]
MQPVLQVTQLTKRFGTLEVLRSISFAVERGAVVGLAGLSGSGKSVIAQILAGLIPPTSGSVTCAGRPISSAVVAQRLGVEVIHQNPILVDNLDITTNIFLGHEVYWQGVGRWLRIPHHARMDEIAHGVLDDLGVEFPSLEELVVNVTAEQRQMIAIARAIVRDAPVIIIDEPTVLLSFNYQQRLLSLVQRWHQAGKTIIFSSTNLDHLSAITDRVFVLREGQLVGEYNTDQMTREQVVAGMVGQLDQVPRITPVIWALDSYYRAREKVDQLYRQTRLLERNLVAQGTINQDLLTQLTEQVKSLDRANVALQDAQRRLLTEREEERRHLARELHDQVIQDLLTANYQIEEITSMVETSLLVQERLGDVRESIRDMIDAIRQICGNLRPPTIDSLGLSAALQSYVRTWAKRTGITADLQLTPQIGRLPEATELSIFRIVQESLNNVYRHSEATRVEIHLEHTSPRTLMISIADDGKGLAHNFDLAEASASGHYGLLGISERVALLSGHLRLQNWQNGGMLLQVEIPHPRVEMNLDTAT